MPTTYNLQVVTPEREIFNAEVESAILNGVEGSFGVLAHHAPLIAALKPGAARIQDADGRDLTLFVGGGFFQVARNKAILLADSAELGPEIDVERAKRAEDRAVARLMGQKEGPGELIRDRAESALARARGRQRLASGR